MATSQEKLHTCEHSTTYKWHVEKFQVKHAIKAADQWDYVTGAADLGRQGYESNKQKTFYSVL